MAWEQLTLWRRALHRIPELGHEEYQTADYVESALRGMGLETQRLTPTGIIAEIDGRGGRGRTVVLRADMDGLPIHEESGEPFSSEHPGMMHACGHDGHMAILLGVAAGLLDDRNFAGTVRMLFQPSEEKLPGGAPAMIAAGCLERADTVLGLHIWNSLPVGVAGLGAGVVTANSDQFKITVQGRGGHGSEPHLTRDAVMVGAQLVQNLQTIVSRKVSPSESVVVTVGSLQTGSAFNIIADSAELLGTVRTLNAEMRDFVESEIGRMAQYTAAMHEATVEVDYRRGYPAVINHRAVVDIWDAALSGLVRTMPPMSSLVGEDFAYYLEQVPGAFLFLGAKPEGETFPHHSPQFRFAESCLPLGVQVMDRGCRAALAVPLN